MLGDDKAVAMVSDAGNFETSAVLHCYDLLGDFAVCCKFRQGIRVLAAPDQGWQMSNLHSSAGMPAISDAGSGLVSAAVAAGHKVIPIPGPSASLAALVASGLPTTEFHFVGFLPAKATARQNRLRGLAGNTSKHSSSQELARTS